MDEIDVSSLDKSENVPDSALSSPVSTWEREVPKLPEEDMKKCYRIVQELQERYQSRLVKDPVGGWAEVQKRAKERFEKIGIKAHVEMQVAAINVITQEPVMLSLAREGKTDGYRIREGNFEIPIHYQEVGMMLPNIVIDDWEDIDVKKSKAEQSIIEREARRARGDSYFPDKKDVA